MLKLEAMFMRRAAVFMLCVALPGLSAAQDTTDNARLDIEETTDSPIGGPPGLRTMVVAVSDRIPLSTQRIQDVFNDMNLLVLRSDFPAGTDANGQAYPGDVACLGVNYALANGSLIRSRQVPDIFVSGSRDFGWDAFRRSAPADVYIVNSITCGTTNNAAGCAPVGGKPRVVKAGSGLNGQVWVHEDMHTEGLGHSNPETPCPRNFLDSQESTWRRIMYCRVNEFAKGLLANECQKIGGTPAADQPILMADFSILAAESTPAVGLDLAIEADEAISEAEIIESLRYTLINADRETLSSLTDAELDAVRSVLRSRTEVDLLYGSVLALGAGGNRSDAELLISFLEDRSVSGEFVTVAKVAVPSALYSIASRLDEKDSAEVMSQALAYADADRAAEVLGLEGNALAVQAVVGLGEAKERAIPLIDALSNRDLGEDADFQLALPGADQAVVDRVQSAPAIDQDLLGVARGIAVSE